MVTDKYAAKVQNPESFCVFLYQMFDKCIMRDTRSGHVWTGVFVRAFKAKYFEVGQSSNGTTNPFIKLVGLLFELNVLMHHSEGSESRESGLTGGIFKLLLFPDELITRLTGKVAHPVVL